MKTKNITLVAFILFSVAIPITRADVSGYPIKDFLGHTVISEVKVSPGGRHVAIITTSDNFDKDRADAATWRIDVDEAGRKTDMVRLTYADAGYYGLNWSPDERYLSFLAVKKPVDTPQLFAFDMRGGGAIPLTDPGKFKEGVSAYDWLPDGSGLIFSAPELLDEKQKEAIKEYYGDAMRFAKQPYRTSFWSLSVANFQQKSAENLKTVEVSVEKLHISPDGKWIAYLSGPPRKPAPFLSDFSEVEIFVLPTSGAGSSRRLTRNFLPVMGFRWDNDSSKLYVSGDAEANADRLILTNGRLYQVGLSDGSMSNLVPDFLGSFDFPFFPGDFVQLPNSLILVNANVSTHANIYAVDPDKGSARQLTDYRGEVAKLSASRNGKLIAFVLAAHDLPLELYLAHGIENLAKAHCVTGFNHKLNQMPKPEVETIRWDNGEGETIEGVIYWPPGKRGEKNLPLVVDIHGGPNWAKTEALFLSDAADACLYYPALLASRGYLVLEPNYRGGHGRGDDFLHAIVGYASSRPVADILTGVDHLMAQGWVDPERMGVIGYSYGGVLTNYLIAHTNRFRAACSGAGIWESFSDFGTSDYGFIFTYFYDGKLPWEDFQQYWNESAISGAANVRTPTLVVTGGSDRRVPTHQSYELYRTLVWLGVPTELLVLPGEGHLIKKPSHRLTKVKAEIAWLDHYLLGKPLPEFK